MMSKVSGCPDRRPEKENSRQWKAAGRGGKLKNDYPEYNTGREEKQDDRCNNERNF